MEKLHKEFFKKLRDLLTEYNMDLFFDPVDGVYFRAAEFPWEKYLVGTWFLGEPNDTVYNHQTEKWEDID